MLYKLFQYQFHIQAVLIDKQVLLLLTGVIGVTADRFLRNKEVVKPYLAHYNALVDRYDKATAKLEALEAKKAVREAKADTIGAFMFELRERDEALTEFDDRLWLATIDTVTAHSD